MNVAEIFLRHLLRGHLDDDAVDFVEPELAIREAEECGVDTELPSPVVPFAQCVSRRSTC